MTPDEVGEWKFLKFWKTRYPEVLANLHDKGVYFPEPKNVFRSLQLTQPQHVKAVILGQDPYPTPGHANGLAFSVHPEIRPLPASLRNIFGEYESDLRYTRPESGSLDEWANRGVLLLNSILTVGGRPLSHEGIGWEKLTTEICRTLCGMRDVVFILWGRRARMLVDHLPVKRIMSAHPSPLSAHNGFFGSKPFSKTNDLLQEMGREPIDWRLV